jgi:uncharacterized membrane protein YhaH (DUF805 family)
MCQSLKKPFEGRMSRLSYLVMMVIVGLVYMLSSVFSGMDILVGKLEWLVVAILFFLSMKFTILRWHDFGKNYMIPSVILVAFGAVHIFMGGQIAELSMIAFAFISSLIPGQWRGNQYGEIPDVRGLQNYFARFFASAQTEQGFTSTEEAIAANMPLAPVGENKFSRLINSILRSFDGRQSRWAYIWKGALYGIVVMISFSLGAALVAQLQEQNLAWKLILIPFLMVLIVVVGLSFYRLTMLTIQRFHDLGLPWYVAVVLLIASGFVELVYPEIGVETFSANAAVLLLIFVVVVAELSLIFVPGKVGMNKYGGDPRLAGYLYRQDRLLRKVDRHAGPEEADRVEALLSMPNSAPVEAEKTEELPKPAPKKKAAAKKAPAKKAPAKKAPAKKPAAKKTATKKTTASKKKES